MASVSGAVIKDEGHGMDAAASCFRHENGLHESAEIDEAFARSALTVDESIGNGESGRSVAVLHDDNNVETGAERALEWLGREPVRPHALGWRSSHQHPPPRFPLATRLGLVRRAAAPDGHVGGRSLVPGYEAREWKRQGRICSAVSHLPIVLAEMVGKVGMVVAWRASSARLQ